VSLQYHEEQSVTLGIIFALLGSLSFSMNAVSIRRGVTMGAASQGLYLTVFSGTVLFLIAAALFGQLFGVVTVTTHEFAFMAASGVVHILCGRYCNYRAMEALGANLAQPIVGTSTLVSVAIAVAFLGEGLNWLQWVGIALVMVGPAIAAPRRSAGRVRVAAGVQSSGVQSGESSSATPAFTPRFVEGYFFGVMAALFWGAGPALMRAGVEDNGLGVLGGTVAYASASLVLLATLALPGQAAGALKLDPNARGLFLIGGLTSWGANILRFYALALAPVSIVVPVMRSSILFTLGMNYMFNRHLESFEPRLLIAIGISMVGATLLVV
jgi:drug/metabolite transporter (DMT)-like permease